MNISSIVVQTLPENVEGVVASLKGVETCEVHFQDPNGKIIVTIEGEGVDDEIRILKSIQTLPHIIAADMMYSYSEEELEQNMEQLKGGSVVPKMLNEEVAVTDITYGGDVNNFVDDGKKRKKQ